MHVQLHKPRGWHPQRGRQGAPGTAHEPASAGGDCSRCLGCYDLTRLRGMQVEGSGVSKFLTGASVPQLARHAYQAAQSRGQGPGSLPQQPAAFAAMQGGAAPPAGVVQIQLLGGGRAAAKTAFNQDFIDLLKCAAVAHITGCL